MNRRSFALSLPALGLLAGCDSEQQPSSTATLLSNGDVQSAMKTLARELDDLESRVGGFDDGNWREVVPEVRASAENVRSAFDVLRRSLGVPNA